MARLPEGVMRCVACGRDNPADALFCNACGQKLRDRGGVSGRVRRPLTVLFCDLVDSTRLSSRLDPEDWRSILVRYYAVCRPAINDHDGLIIQYLGDGILAYFGFPSARETDAVNAVRSGLELIDRVTELAVDVRAEHGIELQIRVGIHSGLVVVGDSRDGAFSEAQAVGDTLNIAARLQGAAAPGGLVISGDTLRMVEGLFVTESQGMQDLKGLPSPIEVWRVTAAEGVEHKLDAASPVRLSPFVGRSRELAEILRLWESAGRAGPRFSLIVGEAGVGKSRLLHEVRARIDALGGRWLQGRCLPEAEQSPFASWSHLLRSACRIELRMTPETALERLRANCETLGLLPEVVDRLAALLGATEKASARTLAADHRRRTIDALVAWLRAQATNAPVVVGLEDLHWADPSTLEVLAKAEAELAGTPVIFLLTARPGARLGLESVRVVELSGLAPAHARELVFALSPEGLSDALIDTILERGSGLPLFIEALMREVGESGGNASTVPRSLLVALAARLDQLGTARSLAQTAAVVGGEVALPLLARVSGLAEDRLLDEASELVAAGLAFWAHAPEGPMLRFKHALIADAAYDSLPRARRRELHGKVAAALDASGVRRHHPERLARHYELADESGTACDLWTQAAKRALRAYALQEAGAHLDRATRILDRVAGPIEAGREIRLRLLQLEYLNMRDGFTGAQQPDVCARVLELIEREEVDVASRLSVLLLITTQTAAVSRVFEANHWADRAVSLAGEIGNPILTGFLGAPAGTARLLNGRYGDARELTETALASLAFDGSAPLVDPRIGEAWLMTQAILAHSCAALGHTGLARRTLDRALAGARAMHPSDPHSLGLVLYFRAMLLLMEGELDRCVGDAREMVEIGDRHGFAEISAGGRMFQASREMLLGDAARGVEEFQRQQSGVPEFKPFPYFQQVLFEGTARAGRPEDALRGAKDHYRVLCERGEYLCSEELLAVAGELHLRCGGDLEAAHALCERGLTEASGRGARGPALRIAIRLARLLAGTSRASEAADLLRAAVASYPEPEDSRRHAEATALLAQIQARVPSSSSATGRTHAH